MNIFDSAIIPKFFLPEEKAGTVSNQSICDSLRACLAFGSTSKAHYALINSSSFCQALISSIGFQRLLLNSFTPTTQSKGLLACQFRQLTQWIKNVPTQKKEEFNGTIFGDAFGSEDGIEIFSFQREEDPILRFLLKDNPSSSQITIPKDIVVTTKAIYKASPHVARSNDFIAINRRGDSAVFCFSKEGVFQKHYEVKGDIRGLTIRDESLYIREWIEDESDEEKSKEKISIGDLTSSEKNLLEVAIPYDSSNSSKLPSPSLNCVFGETHLVLTNSIQLTAIPLASLTKQMLESETLPTWISESHQAYCFSYLFPYGKDFIGIAKKDAEIQIVKIKILETGFQTELLAKEHLGDGWFTAAHLHLGRLFFALERGALYQTLIHSYDLETKAFSKLLSSSAAASNIPFRPKFLCSTASKMHYLLMGIFFNPASPGQAQIKSFLTTFDYEYKTQAAALAQKN